MIELGVRDRRGRDNIVIVSGVGGCHRRENMVFVSDVRDHGRYILYFNLHLSLLSLFLYIRT